MVSLKRIKNKEDLKDVIAYLIEDVNTFKFLSNYQDVSASLSKIIEKTED